MQTTAEIPAAGSSHASMRQFLANNLTYFRLHFLYFFCVSLGAGVAIYGVEGGKFLFVDTLFMATSSLSQTGLSTIDTSLLSFESQVIMLLLSIAGGNVLLSAVPLIIRRSYFRRAAASHAGANEEMALKVLASQAEYGALNWILATIACYWSIGYALPIISLGIYASVDPSSSAFLAERKVHTWWFAGFVGANSFTNTGLTPLADNLMGFFGHPFVLIIVNIATLMGNVAYPILLHYVIRALSMVYPNDLSLKFLRERPRKVYTHLFRGEQTRILLFTVVGFTLLEMFVFLITEYNAPHMGYMSGTLRAMNGWFMAISTRTAGFNSIDLALSSQASQMLTAVMMFVASLPVVTAMNRSVDTLSGNDEVNLESGSRHSGRETPRALVKQASDRTVAGTSKPGPSLSAALQGSHGRVSPLPMQLVLRLPGIAESSQSPTDFIAQEDSLVIPTKPHVNAMSSDRGASKRRRLKSDSNLDMNQIANGVRLIQDALVKDNASGTLLRTAYKALAKEVPQLFIGVFLVCLVDYVLIRADPYGRLNVFTLIFEACSAYGNVGLSVGYPNLVTSLCAQLSTFSKLVFMIMMLAGRHRGLPASIDPAVHLPSLLNKKAEHEPGSMRMLVHAGVGHMLPQSARDLLNSSLRVLGFTGAERVVGTPGIPGVEPSNSPTAGGNATASQDFDAVTTESSQGTPRPPPGDELQAAQGVAA